MKKVNICIGRFQPFTAGHYKCVEAAWKQKRLPTVICMIETAEAKVDKRHPFPSKLLIDLYNELFSNDNRIADVITVKNADIVANSKILAKNGYQIASWTCGTDRYNDYSRMATKYAKASNLDDDFEMIEVKRSDEDISATKVREALLNDDKDKYTSMMPEGSEEMFNDLKKQIDKVYKADEIFNRRFRYYSTLTLEERVTKLERLLFRH